MTRILVTGGCGFVGHHFVEHVLKNTDWDVVIWDKLTYAASGFDRLRDINCFDDARVKVLTLDIAEPLSAGVIAETGDVNYIVHMAAESHVDRSIEDAEPFVRSNVLGTMRMLDYARAHRVYEATEFEDGGLHCFVYFSTDEVFGPAPPGVNYKEDDRYNASNPYAATKAGGEQLAVAYANTHEVPVLITHSMNIIGERQDPEKFVPMVIRKVLAGETVTIHANKDCTQAGSRFYIHARNVADALLFLLEEGYGGIFNIVGEREIDNLTLARMIASMVGKPLKYKLVDFHGSRPGHDLRYSLDGSLLAQRGWTPPLTLDDSLAKTVRWTLDNPRWLKI
jgi:dTDP-glucose 4,6-dehydratase